MACKANSVEYIHGSRRAASPDTIRPPITFDWYRAFIQMLLDARAYTWLSKLVVAGELLVGVALILGAFTGIAAFTSRRQVSHSRQVAGAKLASKASQLQCRKIPCGPASIWRA